MSNVKKSIAERTRHNRQYDRRVNKRQMQTHARYKQLKGNYLTHVVDADIRPINDQVPCAEIIMVNVIPPDHVDEVYVVEPNQHDDVPFVHEPVLVDEDEDPKEDEFEEEEDPQEGEDDMEIDIEKDKNEPKLTYPYEEVDPLNLSPPASESEPNDDIEVENPIEHEDKTIPASTAHALVEKKGKAKDRFYGKLILELGNEVRSSVEIIRPKSEPMNLAAICQMIKDSVTAAIAAEWASECVEGKKNLKVKEYDVVAYTQRFNELALMYPRMAEPERVKVDAYIWGLMDNIMGEVTSSKPADLNKAVRMAYKLMEKKLQARDARILKGKKRKWESLQGGNSSSKGNQRNNSRHTLQNSQKQGNVRAMVTFATNGKLPLCERCFTRHVGQCTIRCHKYGKFGHKARCPKKFKQKEVGEARIRAYAIKDVEPQGLNVVTGTFLLNNHYAFVLFDSGSDRSFVDTRFSAMLDIDPIKIGASYEVELADGRIASTNTVLKGCTLNLVNSVFKIDLMSIELGTFDVIIGMDWLVNHDSFIICGEKVVRIPHENEMLIVKSDKGVSGLKVKENQEKDKNQIKTRQKREACRSREKFKAVAVDTRRKTKENAKRMVENAYTVKENQENDKIGSKPDKNGKRGEAEKSLKQLQ
nr:hypothetical protein [Tanacetum cinerariifolium]